MSCTSCNNTCSCIPRCTTTPCSCPVMISSDCVDNVTVTLDCANIPAGQTLSEVLTQLDTFICEKFNATTAFFTLVNVGTGAQVYKGVDNLGHKQIRTLIESGLINITQNTNDITVTVDETALLELVADSICIQSDTLTVTQQGDGCLKIENPATASATGLFVNNTYVPTYQDFLNTDNLGRGEGTISRPFTDTVTYASPTASPVITPNTAIQNALTGNLTKSYVAGGTALSPANQGETVIIQDNGSTYTFAGNFNYQFLQIKMEGNVVSTTTGFVIDGDSANFSTTSMYNTVDISEGKTFQIQGAGFNNTGNTISTTTYATGKQINFTGKGSIYATGTDATKYVFNSDPNSTSNSGAGSNNDGTLTFGVYCDVRADFQGIYKVGGKSKIDFYGTLTSGLLVGTAVSASLKAFHQTGGQIRMFSGAKLVIYGGTRTDGITFTPIAPFTPNFIGTGVVIGGSITNLFTKTTTASVTFEVTNSPSGYGLVVTNVFSSPNLWPVVFKNNVLSTGSIDTAVADLTGGNNYAGSNVIGSNIIESLCSFTSRENARTNGRPKGTAFLLKKTVTAGSFTAGVEYQVLTSGSPSLGTVGTYFTATGSESGTGTAYYYVRDILI